MKPTMTIFALLLALAGCNDADRDAQKTDTLNSQPINKNPQIDHDPTPESTTGGDQQGTQPSQPAAD